MRKFIPILLVLLGLASQAHAVKVADITRLSDSRPNTLTGLGLVFGLKGTGDGGAFSPAIKPLAGMLGKFSNPTTVAELSNVANVALVSITATIPPGGAMAGDSFDVQITSIGAASSLKGGRLFVTPMGGPIPEAGIYALAQGQLTFEDPTTLTVATVKAGCVMESDFKPDPVGAKFTLVVSSPSASWTTASFIAKIINDAESTNGETLAMVRDPKTIEVTIPPIERTDPASFISRIQRLPVPVPSSEARVQINEKSGSIILSGDVEISPAVICFKGMTISTVSPTPVPSAQRPVVTSKNVVTVDTNNTGGAKLQDLADAFDRIKLPAEDRIAIIKELHKIGLLHAKLIVE